VVSVIVDSVPLHTKEKKRIPFSQYVFMTCYLIKHRNISILGFLCCIGQDFCFYIAGLGIKIISTTSKTNPA
jgi:hypothetical protein